MTKNFCDICGKPAIEKLLQGTHTLPDRAFSGTRCHGVSVVDGTWVPTFTFHFVVRVENLDKRCHAEHMPDLCADCYVMMLNKLADKLKETKPN